MDEDSTSSGYEFHNKLVEQWQQNGKFQSFHKIIQGGYLEYNKAIEAFELTPEEIEQYNTWVK